jgi:ribosome-associated protein
MDIRKLQRVIVGALEDVKAQDIQVFNTEDLTSLFDRVIIASGTSNRQTRALAASVRDDVKAAGFEVRNPEGEETGEWVLVDCGAAVVHIMQPAIRSYYKLEELWGAKPVHLKTGAARKAGTARTAADAGEPRALATPAKKAVAKKVPAKKATTRSPAGKTPAARKRAADAVPPERPAARKAAVKSPARKSAAATSPTRKSAAKTAATTKAPAARRAAPRKPAP